MTNAAINFYGSATVLDAFAKRGLTVWAVFQGRDMCCAGEGSESLEELLTMLGNSNTGPVYVLRMYKAVEDADSINEKTPYNGSYRFKLDGEAKGSNSGSAIEKVLRRLEDIEAGVLLKRLDSIEEKMGAASSDKIDVIGAVNNLISDPPALIQVINGLKMLFAGGRPQAVGFNSSRGPETFQPLESNHMAPEQTLETKINRLQAAIDILEQRDPQLVEHLEKLARLAETNAPMFQMVLQQLDNFVK